MVKQYETVFILTPVLSDSQMADAVKKFKDLLNENGVEIVSEENWGLKKLEYPIQKKSTGFYQLFEFKASPEFILKLDTEYNRDERIMRYLTVSLDKYAIAYGERRRTRLKKEATA